MPAPLVSAIVPVFNGAAYLAEALDSLRSQTYSPLEIVVCDDGSTDGTPRILDRYPEIRVVRQRNRGPAAARNAAIAVADGSLLGMFDADDTWPAERTAKQVDYLLTHPEVDCVLGRQRWIDPPPWLTRDPVYGELDGIPLVSAMYRRSVFSRFSFDESFRQAEDMDLLIRLRESGGRYEVLPDVLVHRRFHGGNATAHLPAQSPVLRSLRQKLQRERAAARQP